MKHTARIITAGIVLSIIAVFVAAPAFAQFTPGQPHWQFDPETTQVGRNAERARELIYWVYSNPPIYSVDVLASTWALVRNITYALTLLVIIGLALHLVLTARKIGPTFTGISLGMERLNLANIVVRVVAILIFITFSYVIVRGFIEGAEITTKFIQTIGGQDLFTIVFGTDGNTESNYQFVGYRNYDPYEQDMVFTSLFLVRLTSFTYNFMAIILIMRHVVLMFLLIISPMLGLLMAFIFIRNTGYIWIAEFFRWLLYGPMFTLFIVSIARIWKEGIPYGFDFGRAIRGEQIFHTSINILYGGPGQVGDHPLSPTNTANYIDTYAEYVIALVMLWTAILLPWLLLRIFRDYCCDVMERNNAAIMQMLDRFRTLGTPPIAPVPAGGPAGTSRQKIDIDLPFRERIQPAQPIQTKTFEQMTKERIIEKINNNELHTVETRELQEVYDLKVESLRDVARLEMQKESSTTVRDTLQKIQNPFTIQEQTSRKQFETLRTEFTKRAAEGDQAAKQIIEAAMPRATQVKQSEKAEQAAQAIRQSIRQATVPAAAVSSERISDTTAMISNQSVLKSVAEKTNTTAEHVEQVLKAVPQTERTMEERITMISERVAVPREQVKKVVEAMPSNVSAESISSSTIISNIAEKTEISKDTVEQILKEVPSTEAAKEDRVMMVSQQVGIPREEVERIVETASTEQLSTSTIINSVSENTNISAEKVERIVNESERIEKESTSQLSTIANAVGIPQERVREVVQAAQREQMTSMPVITSVAEKTQVSSEKVTEILKEASTSTESQQQQTTVISQKLGIPREQVQTVIQTAQTEMASVSPAVISTVAEKTSVSQEQVKEILTSASQMTSSTSEKVETIAQQTGMSREEVEKVLERVEKEKLTSSTIIQTIAQKTHVSSEKVGEILKEASQVNQTTTNSDRVTMISQQMGIPVEQVQTVVQAAQVQITTSSPEVIQQTSEKTQVSRDKVTEILKESEKYQSTDSSRFEQIATTTGVPVEQVTQVIQVTQTTMPVMTPAIVQTVSEKTNTSKEQVEQILTTMSQTTTLTKEESIKQIAEKTNSTTEEVTNVLNAVPMAAIGSQEAPASEIPVVTPAIIQQVSEKTSVEQSTVEQILDVYPQKEGTKEERIEQIAQQLSVPAQTVEKVIGATPMTTPTQMAGGPPPDSPVSIEEYEEIRKMWTNHYRTTEVPVSQVVKDRVSWIDEDIRVLTNTLDLLTSPSPKDKQKGIEEVSTILPFLLLGGFSDVETMIYIKAKLEAAKLVKDELQHVEQVREEYKRTEEFVDVKPSTQEVAATMTLEEKQDLPTLQQTEEPQPSETSEEPSTIQDALQPQQLFGQQPDTTEPEHEENPEETELGAIPTVGPVVDNETPLDGEQPGEEQQNGEQQEGEQQTGEAQPVENPLDQQPAAEEGSLASATTIQTIPSPSETQNQGQSTSPQPVDQQETPNKDNPS